MSSTVTYLGVLKTGSELSTPTRVRRLFERKGPEFVELKVLISGDSNLVMHIAHTAIYRLRGNANA